MECVPKTHRSLTYWDVRHYSCCLIYFLIVSGLASPIEQQKYPSLHNVRSTQNSFLNLLSKNFQANIVLSCLSFLTIDVTDMFGGILRQNTCIYCGKVLYL